MKFSWFSIIFFPQIVISFIAFDCEHSNSNISTLSIKDVAACPDIQDDDLIVISEEIQVVQDKEWSSIHVFHCLIKIIKHISHCGMHSHTSAVEGGLQSYVQKISQADCMKMTETGEIRLGSRIVTELKANSSVSTSFTDVGKLSPDGRCKGGDIITPTTTLYNVVSQVSYDISLKDYMTVMTTDNKMIHFNDGTSCLASSDTCFHTTLGITAWKFSDSPGCTETSVDIIYHGQASITYSKLDMVNPIFVAVKHSTSLFGLRIKSPSFVCHQSSFLTDHNRINVIKKSSFGFFFSQRTINPRNLDLSMYMNSKISFVYDHLETQITKLYRELQDKDCELERLTLKTRLSLLSISPVHYGHLVTNEKGFYGVVAGEVIHILSCQAVDVSIRRTDFCYNHLPVMYNNHSTFMEPVAHILTSSSLEVPCSVLTPNMFDLGDKWVSMTPTLQVVNKPKSLEPSVYKSEWKFETITSLVTSGIYDQEALNSLRNFMSFPMIRTDATNFMASKVSGQHMYQDSMYSGYNMLSREDLGKMTSSMFAHLFGWMSSFGAYAGALWGILMIYQLIKKVFSTVINGWSLYQAFGFGFHMIAMIATSCTHYIFVKQNKNNNKSDDNVKECENHEMITVEGHQATINAGGRNNDGVSPSNSQINYRHEDLYPMKETFSITNNQPNM